MKRLGGAENAVPDYVSPGLTAGGGLKQSASHAARVGGIVSPGLTAGGGLKQFCDQVGAVVRAFPPASPPGAD